MGQEEVFDFGNDFVIRHGLQFTLAASDRILANEPTCVIYKFENQDVFAFIFVYVSYDISLPQHVI